MKPQGHSGEVAKDNCSRSKLFGQRPLEGLIFFVIMGLGAFKWVLFQGPRAGLGIDIHYKQNQKTSGVKL